jgi:hypothetical protein
MFPAKNQHKKRRASHMTYGGVVLPGMPYWSYFMGGVNGFGGGYMTGATPGPEGDHDGGPSDGAGAGSATGGGDAGTGAGV